MTPPGSPSQARARSATSARPSTAASDATPASARPSRLAITSVSPAVAGGYPAKRAIGDVVDVRAVVVCDGHVELGAAVHVTSPDGSVESVPMTRLAGYAFTADLVVDQLGSYGFAVEAWVDQAATLQSKITRKRDAGQATDNEEEELRRLGNATRSDHIRTDIHSITVDPLLASFGAWYEFFPRSPAGGGELPLRHATLADALGRLDYVSQLGFDIVYLPPIHPIGHDHRKGRNNNVTAEPGDVGSPWAIGSADGGHTAVHPDLGTIADLDALVAAARGHGLELAMDIAFQCAPDHPWVTEHPEWFAIRPDGSIAYAENPPKRYQDIVPFDFDSPQWESLWQALADVVRFWHQHGVRVFRVDNPHTKPFRFWEWLIAEMKAIDPSMVFLAEAFAHPEVMMQLSRVGFSVSYTHFPWQHAPWQIEQYFQLLAAGDAKDYFRGSAWPNTPDILTDELEQGLRQVFVSRLVLAATLSASYGIYGPVFELQEAEQRPGSEEYMHNEKYEVRTWDLDRPHTLAPLLRQINAIRHTHAALQHDRSLAFHHCDNPRLLAYSKTAPARRGIDHLDCDPVLIVANTDHYNVQDSYVHLDTMALGPGFDGDYEVEDLLTGERYTWHGGHNYVRLDPWHHPVHVFALRHPDRPRDVADRQKELT